MAMDRSKYPPDWRKRSRQFRARAGDRCERCGVKHGHAYSKGPDLKAEYPATRIVFVRINAAHRYHNTDSSEEADLIALCPRCHARYDRDDIQAKRDYGMNHAGQHQLKLFTRQLITHGNQDLYSDHY